MQFWWKLILNTEEETIMLWPLWQPDFGITKLLVLTIEEKYVHASEIADYRN